MKRLPYQVSLTAPADSDFIEIIDWSLAHFGAAADRYEMLVGQALIDLGNDPFRAGATQREELPEGVWTYHLAGSRDRVAGDRVNAPRHFVLYRVVDARVEVLRLLHDSRDLARYLPEE